MLTAAAGAAADATLTRYWRTRYKSSNTLIATVRINPVSSDGGCGTAYKTTYARRGAAAVS